MAVLTKDEFLSRVKSRLGEELSDDDIAFLEDMNDTYTDFETRIGEDWKGKYEALDKEWRAKYVERFNSGSGVDFTEDATGESESIDEETDTYEPPMTYEELFDVK